MRHFFRTASDARGRRCSAFAGRVKPLVRLAHVLSAAAVLSAAWWAGPAAAKDPPWIWSPEQIPGRTPQAACYFRKSFDVRNPERGEIRIAADDDYQLYVNGRLVAERQSAAQLQTHDITRFLAKGRNTAAVKAVNRKGTTSGLAAEVRVKERGGGWSSFTTDATWVTRRRALPLWNTSLYNDSRWAHARVLDPPPAGVTPEKKLEGDQAAVEPTAAGAVYILDEFLLQSVVSGDQCGSLVAMTFNEFGQLIVSREGGPLLLVYDRDRDKQLDSMRVYCDQVKNCQGLLALNGEVFVTGTGPDGTALYRLTDKDHDGTLESVRTLLKFDGEVGEYGPHGLALGPDGLIYVAAGRHARPKSGYDASSPYRDEYEGGLVDLGGENRSEDAEEAASFGGVVIRTDIDGRAVQRVAGGLRNPYDLAFNRIGDLFVSDPGAGGAQGAPWSRPARVYHVIAGAEFGWRSGVAAWPSYYADSLPPVIETGPGMPTGAAFYNHHGFPARYNDTLFLADWSQGRILNVRLKRSGATYKASSEVFLEGEELSATALEVGPDGALYFVTGGHGIRGGVYRIAWKGEPPASSANLGEGIGAAIRQPQLHSAWGRQAIASLKIKMGAPWDKMVVGVARAVANPWRYRTRAMDLMQLVGPSPSRPVLVQLSQADDAQVRSKAAELMGLYPAPETRDALVTLLADSDAAVRRKACESLARQGQTVSIDQLTASLRSEDRFEAWAARRLLERNDPEPWRDAVLKTENHRLFIQGALALMIAHGDRENALRVLDRFSSLLNEYIGDRDFIDMLRVAQVAVLQGDISPADLPRLRDQLSEEFPASDQAMNRELAELLVRLQVSSILDRYLGYLESDAPYAERLNLAIQLRFIESGWTHSQRLALIEFYENALQRDGGASQPRLVRRAIRDFSKLLTDKERQQVVAKGDVWPDAAFGALYEFPAHLTRTQRESLISLDRQLTEKDNPAVNRLKVAIVAVLGRCGDEPSMAHLREIWDREPQRRTPVAMGLAQAPTGENWDYLLRSLPILKGDAAREVLSQLRSVPAKCEDPQRLQQVIRLGLELKEDGAQEAVELLRHWTGRRLTGEDASWKESLAAWQSRYSDEPSDPAQEETLAARTNAAWDYRELLNYLASDEGAAGDAQRGAHVFQQARCIACHRFGGRGEAMGPDLTSLSKRLTNMEILEAVHFPSHDVAKDFQSTVVTTADGDSFTGLVASGAEGEVIVLQASGEKATVDEASIEDIASTSASMMPDGLLDKLTLKKIADLFAYLRQPPPANLSQRGEKKKRK